MPESFSRVELWVFAVIGKFAINFLSAIATYKVNRKNVKCIQKTAFLTEESHNSDKWIM